MNTNALSRPTPPPAVCVTPLRTWQVSTAFGGWWGCAEYPDKTVEKKFRAFPVRLDREATDAANARWQNEVAAYDAARVAEWQASLASEAVTLAAAPVVVTRSRRGVVTYSLTRARPDKTNKRDSWSVRFDGKAADARYVVTTWSTMRPNVVKKTTTTPRMNPNSLPEDVRSLLFAAMTPEHRTATVYPMSQMAEVNVPLEILKGAK